MFVRKRERKIGVRDGEDRVNGDGAPFADLGLNEGETRMLYYSVWSVAWANVPSCSPRASRRDPASTLKIERC